MNTRKYPRTMKEAFGPYTDDTVYPPEIPTTSRHRIITRAIYIALIVCITAYIVMQIP